MVTAKFVSIRIAAGRLGLCRQTIVAMIKNEHLRAIRTPTGTVRICAASLEEIMIGAKGRVRKGAKG